jgi:methionyl-tRNA formyltransferase
MKVTVLCTSPMHPVNSMLCEWIVRHQTAHEIYLARSSDELTHGDLLFLISCSQIVTATDRAKFKKSLLIHASDLPKGRGWSPHIWEILNGAEDVTVTLLEAEDMVDSGAIWKKVSIGIPKHALHNEINEILFRAEMDLMDFALEKFSLVHPQAQDPSVVPSYYTRRTLADSAINPEQTLVSQFDLIRVCDPARFPAHFLLHGHCYKITIEKI